MLALFQSLSFLALFYQLNPLVADGSPTNILYPPTLLIFSGCFNNVQYYVGNLLQIFFLINILDLKEPGNAVNLPALLTNS
jgi:hypothetical protein